MPQKFDGASRVVCALVTLTRVEWLNCMAQHQDAHNHESRVRVLKISPDRAQRITNVGQSESLFNYRATAFATAQSQNS